MFSKLRQHKRSGSTPTSPTPNSLAGFLQPPPNSSHGLNSVKGGVSPGGSSVEAPSPSPFYFNKVDSNSHSDSPVSPLPPSLPPIPRVASVNKGERIERDARQELHDLMNGDIERKGFASAQERETKEPGARTYASTHEQLGEDVEGKQDHGFDFRHHEIRSSQELGDERFQFHDVRRPSTADSASLGSIGQAMPLQHDAFRSPESQSSSFARSPPTNNSGFAARRHHDFFPSPPTSHDTFYNQSRPVPHPFGVRDAPRQPPTNAAPQRIERQGKTKLHLLNPMSLLMRRRNAQAVEHLSEESLVSNRAGNVSQLPDNYDPSIRGKVVHDFSAPRPRRNFSSQGLSSLPEGVQSRDSSSREAAESGQPRPSDPRPPRHERGHSTHFKEQFEEEVDKNKAVSAIHAETLANKDFIARNSLPPQEGEAPAVLPPFARTAKTVYKPQDAQPHAHLAPPTQPQQAQPMLNATSGPLSPLMEDPASPPEGATPDRSSVLSNKKSPNSRPRVASRTSMNSEFRASGLPSHMFSRASRFSFQYANTDSAAQEKLLEERHKEKAAAAKLKHLAAKNKEAEEDQSEEEENDFDYDDDMDGYDDMEEDVPMVGEEWDYGGGGIGAMPMNSMKMGGGLTLQEAQMALRGNPVDPSLFNHLNLPMASVQGLGILPAFEEGEESEEEEGEEDEEEDVPAKEHFAPDRLSKNDSVLLTSQEPSSEDHAFKNFDSVGLTVERSKSTESAGPIIQPQRPMANQDDDFYFDDGAIDGADFDDTSKFDESVLDDPSHPLFERPAKSPPPIPAKSIRRLARKSQQQRTEPAPPLPNSERLRDSSALHPDPHASPEVVSAYHNALALAATKAEAEGRFMRHDSLDNNASDASQAEPTMPSVEVEEVGLPHVSSRPSLVPDDSRLSQATTMSPPHARAADASEPTNNGGIKAVNFFLPSAYNDDPYSSEWDYSDYDSAMEDDPIIAAANAEALENDDDGFYGSEFGFYARPGADPNSEPGEAVLGGYFGPKNWGEIKRNRSTREPNLTPITERSEYSTRNSFINLGDRVGERGAPSPGLAQLARMSSGGWESEMNMETLRRLRRGAFGGSNGSLKSSGKEGGQGSSMNSSPVLTNPRALWSSPIGREVSGAYGGDGEILEDHSYDALLGEANLGDNDGEVQGEWEDGSDHSSDTDYEGDEVEQSARWHPSAPDSPTIRAYAFREALRSTSPSPTKESGPRLPSPDLGAQLLFTPSSPPTTGSTTLTAPNTVPSLDSRPSSLATTNSQPTSPTKYSHSRNNSDSVAYVREREDGGEVRWFLERRRTGDDGVESLVGRTLVEGGRI